MFSMSTFYKLGIGKPFKFICRTNTHQHQNPFARTWNIVSNELKLKKQSYFPEHTDIVIIGGGFIGSAIAYALKLRAGPGLSVVVLEKDITYKHAENTVLLGTLSQHFSLPENILLAQYSAEFFRKVKEHLYSDIDIQYHPYGRLILASEKYAELLEQNVSIQNEHGIRNKIMSVDEIQNRYPWIDTSGIQLGCISTECEGVFNANIFLKAMLKKSKELGAQYVNAEVVGFKAEKQRDVLMEGVEPGSFKKINNLYYKTPDNEIHTLQFAACIVAAGDQSGHVAKLAQIGNADGLLTVPLPIGTRNYNIYSLDCDTTSASNSLNIPFVMDTSGLWLRKANLGNTLLCGHVPSLKAPFEDDLNDLVKPSLAYRVPGCSDAKIKLVSTEVYDCNMYDDTGILGPHVYHGSLIFATGFGPLGCQHSPGIGRAIAELIIDGRFTSIDLTRFGFDRLLTDYPLVEYNIY